MPYPSLTSSQLTELSNIYMVANTPAYLFKQLRGSQIVQSLAQMSTAEELLAFARNNAISYRMSADQMASAYAALVAATMRPFDEVRRITEAEWPSRIRWAQEIRSIAQSAPATSAHVVIAGATPTVSAKSVPGGKTLPSGLIIPRG